MKISAIRSHLVLMPLKFAQRFGSGAFFAASFIVVGVDADDSSDSRPLGLLRENIDVAYSN